MFEWAHPALIYLIGTALTPLIPNGRLRATLLLLVPVLAAIPLLMTPYSVSGQFTFYGETLTLFRLDRLSFVFALIFSIAAFLATLYAWHIRDTVQQMAALAYAGAAIGAVLAGDLVTLFVWWEGTALASVFLIWARRSEGAFWTGMRYLIVQIASGVALLAGAALYYRETGSLAFDSFSLDHWGAWAILLAFGIKCAFPLLHNWLEDAYPAATVTGTVVLSVFTTKLAVYSLARGFAGTEFLIPIGATMALFPVFYAFIENDVRKVLAYSLNNQLGFMVVGVGLGSELALNGVAAHAFSHILYKALLFMGMGAVLYRTGTAKASELGGLYRSMPWTTLLYGIGAVSIAAPLFCGFVSKAMILSAAGHHHYFGTWLILVFASAAVFLNCALKIPYATFFGPVRFGRTGTSRPAEAPWNMLAAMGLTAALCIGVGVFPGALYDILPYAVDYAPYTTGHVVTQLQLLVFTAVAFGALVWAGFYPREVRGITLDTDWFYRRFFAGIVHLTSRVVATVWSEVVRGVQMSLDHGINGLRRIYGPSGMAARALPTGQMVLWLAILLAVALSLTLLDVR